MSEKSKERADRRLTPVLERNIEELAHRRHAERKQRGWGEQVADGITAFTGSMAFVYIHLVIFGFWIIVNIGWAPGVPRWDPSFVVLAMIASVEAIFFRRSS